MLVIQLSVLIWLQVLFVQLSTAYLIKVKLLGEEEIKNVVKGRKAAVIRANLPLPDDEYTEIRVKDIPPSSQGRCIIFDTKAKRGVYLASIELTDFKEEDEYPIGISIFSRTGCDHNNGFVAYQELDQTWAATKYQFDLVEYMEPVYFRFSVLPIYANKENNQGGGYSEITSPFEMPEEIYQDENLLASDKDILKDFDVPWLDLQNSEPNHAQPEEEAKIPTPLRNRPNSRPPPVYINPGLPVIPSQPRSDSPSARFFTFADSDEEQSPEEHGWSIRPGRANAGSNSITINRSPDSRLDNDEGDVALDINNYDLDDDFVPMMYINQSPGPADVEPLLRKGQGKGT